jgi:hypothetical protein
MMGWPCCFGPVKYQVMVGEHVADKTVHLMARKQKRERGKTKEQAPTIHFKGTHPSDLRMSH